MIYRVYSVFDHPVGAYLPPFFVRSDGEALRALRATFLDPNHRFSSNPEEYSLFFLGQFDDSAGHFHVEGSPESLGNGVSILEKELV